MEICMKILFPIIIVPFFLLPMKTYADNGNCIEGDCIAGKGIYIFSNGEKYEGDFKNGEINGDGTYTYPDRSKYVGEFASGVRHGQGTLKTVYGLTYVGHWANDLPNGKGVSTFGGGMQFSGEFKNGIIYGGGKLVMPDGTEIKIKWNNALDLKREDNRPDSANKNDKDKKDWYMTSAPGKTQKILSQESHQSAQRIEISSQDLTTGENLPSQELYNSTVITEQIIPQASRVDELPDKDKDQKEEISKSNLAEKEKIKSKTVNPVEKRNGSEPKMIFPQNFKKYKN